MIPSEFLALPNLLWGLLRWLSSKKSTCNQETQEMQVQSLGWEDPLEEEMAIHSSTLAWKIPWTVEAGGLQSAGSQVVRRLVAAEQQCQYPSGPQAIK